MSITTPETAANYAPSPAFFPGLASKVRRVPMLRTAKIAGAVVLLCVASFAVLSGQGHITADNSVVSAYTVTLRSPILGTVSGLRVHVGDAIAADTVLAHIHDDRVGDQLLVDLREQLVRTRIERDAYDQQHLALVKLRGELIDQANQFTAARTAVSEGQAAEAERQLAARKARALQTRQDLARKAELLRSGYATVADVNRLTAEAQIADREVAAQGDRVAYLKDQAAAASRGIFLENGGGDITYSTQRSHEVELRLAEVRRTIAALTATEIQLSARHDAEEQRIARERDADLTAPTGGMVWKLGVSEGERVAGSDAAVQIVDCRSAFLIAQVPQDRFSDVEIGGTARFRLSGETTDRTGKVLGVTGESSVASDRNLAAAPVAKAQTATVRIELEPSENRNGKCLVGRTARVLLPATPDSTIFARIARRLL